MSIYGILSFVCWIGAIRAFFADDCCVASFFMAEAVWFLILHYADKWEKLQEELK